MKAVLNRIRRLEVQVTPKLERDFVQNPRDRLRVVKTRMGRPANLATSSCTRYLTQDGCLIEVVLLDGSRERLPEEELERFIASFPVDAGSSGLSR